MAAAISAATSGGPPAVGVGCRAWPTTVPESSTTAAWIFVPPRSIPPRYAMTRTYFPSVRCATRTGISGASERPCRHEPSSDAPVPHLRTTGPAVPRFLPPLRRVPALGGRQRAAHACRTAVGAARRAADRGDARAGEPARLRAPAPRHAVGHGRRRRPRHAARPDPQPERARRQLRLPRRGPAGRMGRPAADRLPAAVRLRRWRARGAVRAGADPAARPGGGGARLAVHARGRLAQHRRGRRARRRRRS